MKTLYFGICCSAHDPAIAIINDHGELVFAEATERSLQYKRGLNALPDHYPYITNLLDKYDDGATRLIVSKNWSLKHQVSIKVGDFLLWAIKPLVDLFPRSEFIQRYKYMLRLQAHSFSFSGSNLVREWKRKKLDGGKNNQRGRIDIRKVFVDHHLCHAAAAAFSSPFDEADVAVVDGYGELTSTAFYQFKDNRLRKIKAIGNSKNSLGFFYSFLCSACEFNPELGEEWKVMGLAPYGKVIPELYDKMSRLIPVVKGAFAKPSFFFDIALYDELLQSMVANNGSKYKQVDVACTGQKVFEDKMIESLRYLKKTTRGKNLILVGGCALNSSCNGKLKENTAYENVFVYNAPGDDGTAVGAAVIAYMQDKSNSVNRQSLVSPYKGTAIEANKLRRVVDNSAHCYELKEDKYYVIAKLLSEGKIIGWVQGRAEFGPRALGNRSILADPRHEDIKSTINQKLKYRENFRPFAPSVMDEYGDEIFENYQASLYMDKTLPIKPHYQDKIKGVTHVNGTGRVQSVRKEMNPDFYRLIDEFRKLTGVPVLLNTSFNLAGKPIVHTAEDAIASFFSSGLNALVINNYVISKDPLAFEKCEKLNNNVLQPIQR